MASNRRIKINISGEQFETFEKTLTQFPSSLLGDSEKRRPYYCKYRKEYVFQKNRRCFDAILFFYQSDFHLLRRPETTSLSDFEDECRFFELPERHIKDMRKREGVVKEETNDKETQDTFCNRAWDILDKPESSYLAWAFCLTSLSIIFASNILDCLKTLPRFKSMSRDINVNPWLKVELSFYIWFSLELIARLITCPSKWDFITNILNWIDTFGILPYFLFQYILPKFEGSLIFMRLLRLTRILRVFRVMKYTKNLRIVGKVMKWTFYDVLSPVVDMAVLIILGASGIYFIEGFTYNSKDFTSIPASLWWTIVTLSTVGYGDVVPETVQGKVFAGIFMTSGVCIFMLPILYMSDRYTMLYAKNTVSNKENRGKSTSFSM